MKETIEVFGGITVKDIIIYMTALYWVYRIAKTWYRGMVGIHDKQQEYESAIVLAKENRDIIDSISHKLDNLIQSDREYKLRSLGDKLFVCYNQGVLQGNTITRRQLENYERNEKLYLALGGNGIVKDKYHPEIMDMRVVEELPPKDEQQEEAKEDRNGESI